MSGVDPIPHQNRTFPRWSAPLVGTIVGGIYGARSAWSEGQPVSPEWIFYGAVAGAAAGCLIFLLDRPKRSLPANALADSSLVGRVFAVISLPSALLPFVGLGVAAVAIWLNRSAAGWPRPVSRIGAGLATIVSVIFRHSLSHAWLLQMKPKSTPESGRCALGAC